MNIQSTVPTSAAGSSHSEPRASAALTGEQLVEVFRRMVRIRAFEDQVYGSLLKGLVLGTTHLCQGQEATCVGSVMALRDDDFLSYTYRGHGVCIARGMSPEAALAELFGRTTGICKGLGGSMHLTDPTIGLMGSFGIVGAGLPFAVGNALAARMDRKGRIAMTFFGDGATNIGAFHESMNLAAVWSLPVIFVCENNLYGEYSRIDRTTPFEDIARRGDAYGIPAAIVDGNDALAVYDAVCEAAARARAGRGPTLVECKTYRQGGHSRTDPAKYRPSEEVEVWMKRDPLILMRDTLKQHTPLTDADADGIEIEIRRDMELIAARAAAAPWPTFDEEALRAATYA